MVRLLPVVFYSDTVDLQESYTRWLMAYSAMASVVVEPATKAGTHDSCQDWYQYLLYIYSRGARIVLCVGGCSQVAHEEKYYSLLLGEPSHNG